MRSEVSFFTKLLFRFPFAGIAVEVSAKNVPPARFLYALTQKKQNSEIISRLFNIIYWIFARGCGIYSFEYPYYIQVIK